jgi:anhydro-N-acetylmuramic acid kinase
MGKMYTALGLMSGTSMDGVDASIIQSDGETKYKVIKDKYFEYPQGIYEGLTKLRDKINNDRDLKTFSSELKNIEKEITLFHIKAINEILKESKENIDLLGFHGQTIYHNAKEKISKQLGDGKLLSQLTKKTIVYNFRENDLKNGGEGAPLTPIFHKMLAKKFKIVPATFLNLGGIANETNVYEDYGFHASDTGPGMCLIDQWIRLNSKKKYDKNGEIAKSGKINRSILEKALKNLEFEHFKLKKRDPLWFEKSISYDIKDFNFDFVRGLSLEDGAATLTEYTAHRLLPSLNISNLCKDTIVLCGGGRKNKFLINSIKKYNIPLKFIDDYGIDGDFVESQAFAYLAIRSYLNLPISFSATTGVKKPCTGGTIVKAK